MIQAPVARIIGSQQQQQSLNLILQKLEQEQQHRRSLENELREMRKSMKLLTHVVASTQHASRNGTKVAQPAKQMPCLNHQPDFSKADIAHHRRQASVDQFSQVQMPPAPKVTQSRVRKPWERGEVSRGTNHVTPSSVTTLSSMINGLSSKTVARHTPPRPVTVRLRPRPPSGPPPPELVAMYKRKGNLVQHQQLDAISSQHANRATSGHSHMPNTHQLAHGQLNHRRSVVRHIRSSAMSKEATVFANAAAHNSPKVLSKGLAKNVLIARRSEDLNKIRHGSVRMHEDSRNPLTGRQYLGSKHGYLNKQECRV